MLPGTRMVRLRYEHLDCPVVATARPGRASQTAPVSAPPPGDGTRHHTPGDDGEEMAVRSHAGSASPPVCRRRRTLSWHQPALSRNGTNRCAVRCAKSVQRYSEQDHRCGRASCVKHPPGPATARGTACRRGKERGVPGAGRAVRDQAGDANPRSSAKSSCCSTGGRCGRPNGWFCRVPGQGG